VGSIFEGRGKDQMKIIYLLLIVIGFSAGGIVGAKLSSSKHGNLMAGPNVPSKMPAERTLSSILEG